LRCAFAVRVAAFSPDGRSLAAAPADERSVAVWDLGAGRGLAICRERGGVIPSIA
jgi:WD40 repeat protein